MPYNPLEKFKKLLLTADPKATRYTSKQQGNYTVWAEYEPITLRGDDTTAERAWKVQIDRFTKTADDPVAAAITAMLDNNEISYTGPLMDYEQDTGYIHHIWDCTVD